MSAEVVPLPEHRPQDDPATLIDQLRAALRSRDVIGMAKGILIASEGVGPDEAFEILTRASQRENRKLREVAADLVTRAQATRRERHGAI